MIQTVIAILILLAGIAAAFLGKKKNSYGQFIAGIGLCALGIAIFFDSLLSAIGIFVAAAGIVCLKTASRKSSMKFSIAGIAAFIIGFVCIVSDQYGLFNNENAKLLKKELQFNDIQAEYLGQFAKKEFAGHKIGVVLPGNMSEKEAQWNNDMIAAFEKGFGEKVAKIVTMESFDVTKPPEEGETEEDVRQRNREAYSAAKYDEAIAETGCDVVLSFAGFPLEKNEVSRMSSLSGGDKHLLLPLNGNNQTQWILSALQDGSIAGLVLQNAKPFKLKNDIPESLEEAFSSRYILVTPKNAESLAASEDYRWCLTDPADEQAQDAE